MASKFVVNTTMQAVDELAKLRIKMSQMKARADELSDLVNAKLSKKAAGVALKGYTFEVSASTYDMRLLSELKVAKYLTDAQLAKCFKTTHVSKLVFSKRGE